MRTAGNQAPSSRGHLAIFIPSLRGGGAERIIIMLANGFAARGLRVDLVLAKAEGPYLSEVSANVRVVDLDKDRVLASLVPLARYLRHARPDAMLSALNHANVVAILARKLARVPTRLVVSEHNSPSQSLRGRGKPRLLRILIRMFYPQADRVVCVSKGIEQDLHRLMGVPSEILETIHNPVDIDAVREKMHDQLDHPWLAERTGPLILAVGRLNRQKDYPTLLAAFARLSADRVAQLVILGQGQEEKPLKTLARDLGIDGCVAFPGFEANPFTWMRRCDLFVMSSAWEGFGNVLVEAMATGASIVSTDCPSGPSEILDGGRWGRLVPVDDAQALARAMAEALDDANLPDVSERVEAFRVDRALESYAEALLL